MRLKNSASKALEEIKDAFSNQNSSPEFNQNYTTPEKKHIKTPSTEVRLMV